MARFPATVNAENFAQAWRAALVSEATVKQKKLIRALTRPIGGFLFTFFSFMLVFGGLLALSSPEEMIVFEKLEVLLDLWDTLSAPFFGLGLHAALVWVLMIVVALFVLPLLVSACLALVAKLCIRPASDAEPAADANGAKALCARLDAAKEKNQSPHFSSVPWRILFTLALGGFLVYAFLKLEILLNPDVIVGMLFFLVLLYFIYKIPFALFAALNNLFCRPVKGLDAFADAAFAYRKKVDPSAEKAYEKEPALTPDENGIVELDSFTWTEDYVREHESRCSEVLLNTLEVGKEFVAEGNYDAAQSAFRHIVIGLMLLSQIAPDHYLPPLFANCYALARIEAFGLHDRTAALENARRACEKARECGTDAALRDLAVMSDFADALASNQSMSDICEEFGHSFPGDLL